MLKRLTSLLLVLAMVITMLPVSAFAEETEPTESQNPETSTVATEDSLATEEASEASDVASEPETNPAEDCTTSAAEETEAPEESVSVETIENTAVNAAQEEEETPVASGSCGTGLTWALDDAGVLTISGEGAMEEYTNSYSIPWYDYAGTVTAVVMEPGITTISDYAFADFSNATQISIPDTVTTIGYGAFRYCLMLESIVIPDSVTQMEGDCFCGCDALRSVTLSSQLTVIPEYTFEYCYALEEITLPSGLLSIEKSAFESCNALQQIWFPNGLVSIGAGAFGSCTALQKAELPPSLKSIEESAFYGCSSLEKILIPDTVTELGARAFSNCTGLTSAYISAEITVIPEGVFSNCTNLKEVTLPANLTRIEGEEYAMNGGAFYGCSALRGIDLPDTLTYIGNGAFCECTQLETITMPNSVTELGECCFYGCDMLERVVPSTNLTEIPRMAFSSCKSLKHFVIPIGVTVVGESAFSGCESLETLVMADTVETLEDSAFASCTNLTYINLSSGLKKMLGRTFYNSGLTSLHIPASVEIMTSNPVADCYNLKTVTVDSANGFFCVVDGVLFLKDGSALVGYPHGRAGTSYAIPEGTKVIASAAFMHTNLESITFPQGLEAIGESAFWNTFSLTEVVLPAGLRSIESAAFYGSHGLKRVVLPDGLKTLGVECFFLCSNLEEINIPNSLTTIPSRCFASSGLVRVLIPEGVTTIETGAFGGYDNKLKIVALPASLETLDRNAFSSYYTSTVKLDTLYFGGTQEQWEDELYGNYCVDYDNIVYNFSGVLPEVGVQGKLNWELSGEGVLTITGSGAMEHLNSASEYSWYRVRDKVKRVIIGESITTIGHYAFDGYDKMLNVQLPSTLNSVNDYAFRNCSLLAYASYPGSAEEWESVYVSFGNDALKDAIICLGEMKDLVDNQNIRINGPGSAVAWYKTLPRSDVEYIVNNEKFSATSDHNGVFSVPLGTFEEEGETKVTIQFTKLSGIPLGTSMVRTATVTVTPITFKQTWKLSMDVKVGAEIGAGAEAGVGVAEAKADLASVGVKGGAGRSIQVEREVSGSSESLELISECILERGVEFESGITGDIMAADGDLLSASASASAGVKVLHGLKFDRFNISDFDHRVALGTFFLGEGLGANPNNLILNAFYVDLIESAYKKCGGTYVTGNGISFGASGDVGALKLKVQDQDIFTAAGVEGSISISMDGTTAGSETKKTTNFTSEFNPSLLSINGLNSAVSGKYLSKDTTVTAIKDGDKKSVEATILDEASGGLGLFFLDSHIVSKYNQYVFKDEALDELLQDTKHYDALLNGYRIAVTANDLVELNNTLASSKIPVHYNDLVKTQVLQKIPLSFNLQVVVGLSLDVILSSLSALDYISKTGFVMEDQIRHNTVADDAEAFADQNMVTIQDLIAAAGDAMVEKAKDFFDIRKKPAVIGIVVTWGWVKAKVNSATESWVTFVSGSSEEESQAYATSHFVNVSNAADMIQRKGALSRVADTSSEAFSKAATVGRPFFISVTEGEDGPVIADFSDEPLELTIRYAAEDLEAAGLTAESDIVRNNGIKMYRYSDEGDYFECVGGVNDLEAMTVTADITKPGQYVLAVDACAPSLSYLDVSEGANPTITAHIDDLTGLDLSSCSFLLDGEAKADGSGFVQYYNAEAGIFTYTVPTEEALAHGTHTLAFRLADTSGNEKTYEASFIVDLKAPVVSDFHISGFTSEGRTVEIRANVSDDNLTCVEAFFSRQLADGTWSPESAVEMVDLGDGIWGLDYEGSGGFVRIYVKATDIANNTAVTQTLTAMPCVESIEAAQDYLALRIGKSAELKANVQPVELAQFLTWKPEGETEVITVTEDGTITARNSGTAYVIATVDDGETELTARCRVDVAEAIELDGVQLSTTKLTSELFSTDYAQFELLLKLPQNMNFQSLDESVIPESNSVAIEDVYFTASTTKVAFDLVALDDRRIAVVPTEYAVEYPEELAKTYKSKVTVVVEGKEYTTEEELTLTLKQTKPKLKVTVPTFNSFYTGQTQEIKVTGGTVTGITLDPNKTQPDWLTLNADGTLSLNENEAQKSGKVYLVVETAEWRIPADVTLAVKNARKTPGLKLSATSVKMTADAADSSGIALKLLPKSKKDSLAALKVADLVSQTAGYTVTGFDAETGSFILKADSGFVPGKVTLNVSFTNTDEVLPLTVKVSVQTVSLKLSAKTVTLNKAIDDSAVVTITATPADYILTAPTIEGNEAGLFDLSYENGKLTIRPTDAAEAGKTYKLSISAGGSKKAALTVKVIDAEPTLTLKAKGNIDLSFPDKAATVTAAFKSYTSGAIEDYTAVVTAPDGTTSDDFTISRDGTVFAVTSKNTDVATGTYKLNLKLTLPEGTEVENTVKLTVKRTAVKLKLSPAKLTLNSTIADKASVAVTCATKGYDFSEPIWELKAKNGKDSAEGALDISWSDGKLNIAVNDNTEPGATYKLLVKANAYAPAAPLTITIPTEAKSVIKSSLKAKGAIDVIRAGSAVTITPSYKNAAAAGEETLNIYSSADNYAEPVNDLFNIEKDSQGRYVLTAAEGLDHSKTYKAELVTEFEGIEPVKSALTKFTVKMGSAKLTLNAEGNILFGNDCRSRIGFTFSAKDSALNAVQEVAIKADKKGYDQMLEVIDLGNGEFAIGFKDETVDRSLLGKTITVTLNIKLQGNETEKVNTTAKLKLTVLN